MIHIPLKLSAAIRRMLKEYLGVYDMEADIKRLDSIIASQSTRVTDRTFEIGGLLYRNTPVRHRVRRRIMDHNGPTDEWWRDNEDIECIKGFRIDDCTMDLYNPYYRGPRGLGGTISKGNVNVNEVT